MKQAEATLKSAQQKLAAAKEKQQSAAELAAQAELEMKQAGEIEQTKLALQDGAYQTLSEQFTARFGVGALKPLSPEQLAWSMMQASGQVTQQEQAVGAELDKKEKLESSGRSIQLEAAVNKKLQGNVAAFTKTFGADPGQPQGEFFGTVDQALFFTNGSQIRGWLNPAGDNLIARLVKLKDPATCAKELYLAVLTRYPTPQEVTDITEYLNSQPETERTAAVQELAWALLTSAEFRFGH